MEAKVRSKVVGSEARNNNGGNNRQNSRGYYYIIIVAILEREQGKEEDERNRKRAARMEIRTSSSLAASSTLEQRHGASGPLQQPCLKATFPHRGLRLVTSVISMSNPPSPESALACVGAEVSPSNRDR